MLSIATFIAFLALAMLGLPIAHALIVGAQLGLMPSVFYVDRVADGWRQAGSALD